MTEKDIAALKREVKFNSDGLVPAVAQSAETGVVLMQAYMNEEALEKTLETGYAHYYSRSRKCLWQKGESSGNVQKVVGIYLDCDYDCILLKVLQTGGACHTGEYSCFHNTVLSDAAYESDENMLEELYSIVKDRKANPQEGSYTNYLFDKGIDKILKKVGEECIETVIAAKNEDEGNEELKYEIADFMYHLTVLMVEKGLSYSEVYAELKSRHKK